jgi:putative transposase
VGFNIWPGYASETKRRAPRRGDKWHMDEMCLVIKGLLYVPRVIITDKLPSYGAKKEILPGVEHRQHKGLNNRAENSHQPTRQQEKQMRKFKSMKQAQRFLPVHGQIRNLFGSHRYKMARK